VTKRLQMYNIPLYTIVCVIVLLYLLYFRCAGFFKVRVTLSIIN